LPSPLLRTHPPPSRLSAHFVIRLIAPTLAPVVSFRDEEGFPSCHRSFLSVSPLLPRHCSLPYQPALVKECCLRPLLRGSASGTRLLRGYICVHVSYDPDIRSPAYSGLCRWASESNVSITPCHPSYMASGFLPWRDFHPQVSSTLCWARCRVKGRRVTVGIPLAVSAVSSFVPV
jgi:hypothetical protein